MAIRQLNPYIHFNGEAEAAIKLYEEALGAKVVMLTRYAEAPMPMPDDHERRIMHAELRVDDHPLMLSDGPPGTTMASRSAMQVALDFTDRAAMTRAFALLAAGGEVAMPLQDMFWGGHMGMLIDRFGVRWMLMQTP